MELVTRLDRQTYEPYVLCLYGTHPHFAPALAAVHIPVSYLNLSLSPLGKLLGMLRIIQAGWALHPAIIQAENYHANLLTRLARPFLPPVKLIGTVRGVYSARMLRYERLSYRLCSVIVTNAPNLKPMLEQDAGVPAARIEVIPNGIDTRRFAEPPDRNLRESLFPGARRVFLVIGRITAEKNIHLTVQAFGRLKRERRLSEDVLLVIVGPIHEQAAQVLIDAAIEANGLHEIVVQKRETAQPENYYHACDACIVFSSPVKPPAEGLPSVLLEALAAGRPVIASDVANAAGVIREGVNGWCVPAHDVTALAGKIDAVIRMPDEALREMSGACQQEAQHYTVGAMVESYDRLYQRCLST